MSEPNFPDSVIKSIAHGAHYAGQSNQRVNIKTGGMLLGESEQWAGYYDHRYHVSSPSFGMYDYFAPDEHLSLIASGAVLIVNQQVQKLGPRLSSRIRVSQQEFWETLPSAHSLHVDPEERQWRETLKKEVSDLLESGEEIDLEAAQYAYQVVDQLPFECTLLPTPDVSEFADKKGVYFEWTLATDGRMLLTVEPDGTVACVCTFGNARSRNLGAWEDKIVDLMHPCFVKLVHLHEKDSLHGTHPGYSASYPIRYRKQEGSYEP